MKSISGGSRQVTFVPILHDSFESATSWVRPFQGPLSKNRLQVRSVIFRNFFQWRPRQSRQ